MFEFCILLPLALTVLLSLPLAPLHATPSKKLCQSGLREDNTNYIYCARQNLPSIPNLFSSIDGVSPTSNVLYDELVLSDNLIQSIDAHTFSPTLKVKKLFLDMNPLRSIHASAFKHLRNYLEEVYFEQKKEAPLSGEETNQVYVYLDYP